MMDTLKTPVAAPDDDPDAAQWPMQPPASPEPLERGASNALLEALQAHRYEVTGARVQRRLAVYAPIGQAGELPVGYVDPQEEGGYRLTRGDLPHRFLAAPESDPAAWCSRQRTA